MAKYNWPAKNEYQVHQVTDSGRTFTWDGGGYVLAENGEIEGCPQWISDRKGGYILEEPWLKATKTPLNR